jgi:hypothetical protein
VVSAAMHFADVDPEGREPDEKWMARFTDPEEARRSYVVAKMSWLSKSKAPVAIEMAGKIALGIHVARQRRRELDAPVVVNLNIAEMPSADMAFERQLVVAKG